MVISQQSIQEVQHLVADKSLVVRVHETLPALLGKSPEDVVVLLIQLDFVFVEVVKQVFCTQHLRNLDELVRIAVAVEEWLFAEDNGCEHCAKGPHVEGIVVFLEVDEELGAFEVAGSDADVVFCALMVEFGETPVNETKLG